MQPKHLLLLLLTAFPTMAAFSQSPERMLTKTASSPKPPTSAAAIGHFDKGEDYLAKKQYPAAIKAFKQAAAIDSDYIDAYNNIGLCFFESAAYDSAAWYLQISLRKFPTGTIGLQNMALVEEKRDHIPQALDMYKKIIAIEPENPEGYYNTARILAQTGKLEESIPYASQAEKLYAKNHEVQIADCHYLQFAIYYNLHDKAMTKKYRELCKKENVQIPADMASDPN